MRTTERTERIETLVIGGGQQGLTVGYFLRRLGRPFVIVDAHDRVGDAWRQRWDSLRLFTPARWSGLAGMPFPAKPYHFPTKDEMADYLERYAERFELPVRTGVRIERLAREDGRFVATAGATRLVADNVVVAMSSFQDPAVPSFAKDLSGDIVQLHSLRYSHPEQLPDGDVLVVGAGNSGAEIALELARRADGRHRVWLSGRPTGHVPFDIHGLPARLLLIRVVLRVLFHRVLTVDTPVGRKVRPKMLREGGPLVRIRPGAIERAGVVRVPRVAGARDGRPLLDDGRTLDPAGVVWATGFRNRYRWIDLPIHGDIEPIHDRGVVPGHPGLFFTGLHFQYSLSSEMIHAAERDAGRIARAVADRGNRSGHDNLRAPETATVGLG